MSGGDKNDPFPFTRQETQAILRLPSVTRNMRRRVGVNREFDIPYLAGYSRDGRTIYIDRDLKPWPYQNAAINTERYLAIHEDVEKALIDALRDGDAFDRRVLLDCLRMKAISDQMYFHCHGVATCAELYAVDLAHGPGAIASYNKFMRGQIKRAEDERIRRVPADLDMTPYAGADAQDRRLRAAMARART